MLRTLLASAALSALATSALAVTVSIDAAPTGTMVTFVDLGNFAAIDTDFMGAYSPTTSIETTITFDPGFIGSIHADSAFAALGPSVQTVTISQGATTFFDGDVHGFAPGTTLASGLEGAVSVFLKVDTLVEGFNSIDIVAKQAVVPIPAAGLLLLGGLGGLAALRRKAA